MGSSRILALGTYALGRKARYHQGTTMQDNRRTDCKRSKNVPRRRHLASVIISKASRDVGGEETRGQKVTSGALRLLIVSTEKRERVGLSWTILLNTDSSY